MKQILTYLLFFLLFSCNESISTVAINSDTKFGTTISLEDDQEGSVSSAKIRIFDEEDKTIATNEVAFYINSTQLFLSGGYKQNFYSQPAKFLYYTDSIPKAATYQIKMLIKDSISYDLASYVPAKMQYYKNNISWSEKGNYEFLKKNFLVFTKKIKLFSSESLKMFIFCVL